MQAAATQPEVNKFQAFFEDEGYIQLKNHLYNYQVRKQAIRRYVGGQKPFRVVEVGSGISPVVTDTSRIVYSDMSFAAIRFLKQSHQKGMYVVADGTALPFKDQVFSHAVCSEVLEHIEADRQCLTEMHRILKSHADLIVTVPHRKAYFGIDDRAVGHHRRYEIDEIRARLGATGFRPTSVDTVLGPLEKVTMELLFHSAALIKTVKPVSQPDSPLQSTPTWIKRIVPFFKWFNLLYMLLVRIEARLMPLSMATVLLITAKSND